MNHNHATIRGLMAEEKGKADVFERMPAKFRKGSLRLTSMPEDSDDQELLAVYYEQLAIRTRAHIRQLEKLLRS
ncbi:MAG TPA: hypothetical protein VES66_07540 [Terriglobales bacterium]|nr:hypothetical protein [Terriglobales bacterium]